MSQDVRIPIPAQDPNDWVKFFNEIVDELRPALDFDFQDPRTVELDDTLKVEDVQMGDDGVFIEYTYDWEIYTGCSDSYVQRPEYLSVSGIRDGDDWVFKKHISPEPRSTHEEY